ncbi:TIR domain-containing protein [Comamonas jiangduensis]|uniref:TIR domain-containing protein n=1 Tax=Comamonas jiangduensis TaxID=1194168 RepID=UPI003BF8A486
MQKPSIFIASSVEGLPVADAINANLDHDFYCTLWRNGTFRLGSDGLSDLIEKTSAVDFAVFVFTPDDVVLMREQQHVIARDNVVFELGLFIGAIGKDRCYVVKPRGQEMHLPSDVAGVVTADYESDRPDKDIASALNFACTQIKGRVAELGVLSRVKNIQNGKRLIVNSPDYEISNIDLEILANCVSSQVSNPVGSPFDVISRGVDAHEHQISLAVVKLSRMGYIEKILETNNYDGCEYFSYRATEDGLDLFLRNERAYAEMQMNKGAKSQTRTAPIRKAVNSGGFDDMDDDLPF